MAQLKILNALASAILAGEPTPNGIVERCAATLGKDWAWLRPMAHRFAAMMEDRTRPRHGEVVQFLRNNPALLKAEAQPDTTFTLVRRLSEPNLMQPVAAAATWDMPRIESTGELAQWLSIRPPELDWFADLKALGYKSKNPLLRHYHYRILGKGFGTVRLIESPKPRLKELQRRILTEILQRVPPHPAAQGFIKKRSIRTFAAPHVGQRVVVRMDLQDFFPSISGARVQTLFRVMGYPERVADLLGGICTNAAPHDIWSESAHEARDRYARPHLPQGAPSSPALANICAWRVDCRLSGLAESAGARYTRYADDLVFSGGADFERRAERFSAHAAAILLEEGFEVHHRKTRVMRQSVRQQMAGIVVNEKLNLRRDDFDRLKATLTNCVRHGAGSQNRSGETNFRAHLEGRVAFVESINLEKGRKLRAILERVEWE